MKKVYRSGSEVTLSVTLPSGGWHRIRFYATSDGGSRYVTDDAVLQELLEKHPRYGTLFSCEPAAGNPVEKKPRKK